VPSRITSTSFELAEAFHAIAFSMLSKAIRTNLLGAVPSSGVIFSVRITYLPPKGASASGRMKRWPRSDVHLMFTDAEMSGTMDGIELVHYIRNRWPPVKPIVVSGKTEIAPEELPRGGQVFS
jgi:CheY-like chemotaxis protein